ncbi:MAG: methyltransferase domain-containing protein [Alphaproteobacteria bacterium]|nr:methyltransferase domain-containing protein [Alphaproteobacteria bacterium]
MSQPMLASGDGRVHRDCPSCRAPARSARLVHYSHPDWPMKQCPDCGLIYLEWVPAYGALYDEIAWTRQHKREEERRLKEQPILARIDMMTRWRLGLFGDATPASGMKQFARPGPVLDVGCSVGKGFAALAPAYIPHGIEIESRAAAIEAAAFEPRGGRVVNADGVTGLSQFPEHHFTGVTLWSYLEHEARPRESLEAVRRVLRKDGVALIKVPNYACWNRMVLGHKWPGFRHPDHVQYFTPPTLAFLAKITGFDVKFRLYGQIPLNDNMYAVLRPR